MNAPASAPRRRLGLRVVGLVQGVGFRPQVLRLARACGLGGTVRNEPEGVWIEVEGTTEDVARFPALLREHAPRLARIDSLQVTELPPLGEETFHVGHSEQSASGTASVPPDTATCEACLAELWDPNDRRHRHPFINCTDCGPRFTLIRDVPYDRARTTMARFELCVACRAEYEAPEDRRFHAEPIACRDCGPTLRWRSGAADGGSGEGDASGDAALACAVQALREGAIVAVKGLGGYQLMVDASAGEAVARLRARKRRPHKAFAVMARDLGVAEELAELDELSRSLLTSAERPIVLVRARPGRLADEVAPGLREVGLMLPYTPLHHLLSSDGPRALVVTSGNLADEPIAREDEDALRRLAEVADGFLLHDREIHARADDSVVRPIASEVSPIRLARGYVPRPILLTGANLAPPLLAVGAELKNTVCLAHGGNAFLSQHVGDLSNPETFGFFEEVIDRLQRLLGIRAEAVAHDLHPDYASTRWALQSGLPRIGVQHHHAHVAACMAEHGEAGPVIGVAFDGTGCGPSGELWGGEFLVADLRGFRREGHLRPLALPGGETAIRQPWRLALAALRDAGESLSLLDRVDPARRGFVEQMVDKQVRSPLATSAGRWFDAVAALCGIRDDITYEAQGAMELEALADPREDAPYPFEVSGEQPFQIDLRPTVRALVRELHAGMAVSRVSGRFHATLAHAVREGCRRMHAVSGLKTVALSGGCFQNRLFTEHVVRLLGADGYRVLLHRTVPPNDGGLSLGQAAIAACRWEGGEHVSWRSR